MATGRHFDKSLLTLVMHASDVAEDKFLIGPNPLVSPGQTMRPVDRYVEDPLLPGTGLLFPGGLWTKIGVRAIKPSPHAVEPVTGDGVRYSTIAFLMLPEANLDDVITSH